MTDQENKFVVVLNKSYEFARLTSGFGHVTAGLVASLSDDVEQMRFLEYKSADGELFNWISDYSFIVLKGRGGQLKTLRNALQSAELPCVTYLDTMLEGGTAVEQAATSARTIDELEILALATFGNCETVDGLTKKFSLFS